MIGYGLTYRSTMCYRNFTALRFVAISIFMKNVKKKLHSRSNLFLLCKKNNSLLLLLLNMGMSGTLCPKSMGEWQVGWDPKKDNHCYFHRSMMPRIVHIGIFQLATLIGFGWESCQRAILLGLKLRTMWMNEMFNKTNGEYNQSLHHRWSTPTSCVSRNPILLTLPSLGGYRLDQSSYYVDKKLNETNNSAYTLLNFTISIHPYRAFRIFSNTIDGPN